MISEDVILGQNVNISQKELVNLYGCQIGDGSTIGPFVEIQHGVVIGCNCKISSHSFICEGVTIEDDVFIGHGVMFTNDVYPSATNTSGNLQSSEDWAVVPTLVQQGASIGSNATIIAGVTVGANALVGVGAVVTRDVPEFAIVAGVPAKLLRDVRDQKRKT